jgi:cell fate regulator YaaT (PSP1 superfamily)
VQKADKAFSDRVLFDFYPFNFLFQNMSCTSCSSGKDGVPAGCGSNGNCGTGGCNKMNVYNWLSNMQLPHGQEPYDIVEVRFKGSRKEFFKNKDRVPLQVGEIVAVEGSPGHDIGIVSLSGELVRFQLRKKNVKENSEEVKTLFRLARPADIEKWEQVKKQEVDTMHRARKIALSLKLNMKLSDVEYQGDGKKATFFYTADERVDFRELIKRLADEFKVRIEMRQIGMRQEASRLGGIGSCGRELCCSTWLSDFRSVSTSAARYQNLSLNPLKLAGQCGKLKCCLNYELDGYMDALKDFPDISVPLVTEKGKAFHRKTDIFKGLMWYAYATYHKEREGEAGEGSETGNWIMVPAKRAKEIVELNKKSIFPAELSETQTTFKPILLKKAPDFEDVVGQDSITRMDNKRPKKKKHKRKPNNQPKPEGPTN